HAPFLLLGFMFQLIARHLLHTLNIIVVESFTTPRHYCPMSVQPLPVLTVTVLHKFPPFYKKTSEALQGRASEVFCGSSQIVVCAPRKSCAAFSNQSL
ncbi:hypothetical protein ACOMD2_13920, partial [Hominicoprocola fusiformis]